MWWAVIVGAILGVGISVIFGIYSKKTATKYARSIFGMASTDLIKDAILMLVALSFTFMITISALVRDLDYPNKSPVLFSIETLMMATFSAMTIFFMSVFRGYGVTVDTFEEFFILFAKFGLLHVLFQFSGFYSYIFPPK